MKCLFGLVVIILAASIGVSAQAPATCPAGFVCITPEAARKALTDSDTVAAQQIELKAKDQAIEDLRKELNQLRIELAKATGDKTGAEQMNVRLTAIIDLLLKSVRPKKIGFINF